MRKRSKRDLIVVFERYNRDLSEIRSVFCSTVKSGSALVTFDVRMYIRRECLSYSRCSARRFARRTNAVCTRCVYSYRVQLLCTPWPAVHKHKFALARSYVQLIFVRFAALIVQTLRAIYRSTFSTAALWYFVLDLDENWIILIMLIAVNHSRNNLLDLMSARCIYFNAARRVVEIFGWLVSG